MLTIMCFGDLWNWTLKIKIKHRYKHTNSALMGYWFHPDCKTVFFIFYKSSGLYLNF